MPYQIQFENKKSGVVIAFTGNIAGTEILAANGEMYKGDKENLLRYQIWDFSGASGMDMDEESIRDAALQDRQACESNPDQMVAIIGSDDFFQGIDKRFAIYSEVWSGFRAETFNSMAEAHKWVEDERCENKQVVD